MGHIPCSGLRVSVQAFDWCSSMSARNPGNPGKLKTCVRIEPCPMAACVGKVGRWEGSEPCPAGRMDTWWPWSRAQIHCSATEGRAGAAHSMQERLLVARTQKWGALGEFAAPPAQGGWSWRTWGPQGLEADSPHPPEALMCLRCLDGLAPERAGGLCGPSHSHGPRTQVLQGLEHAGELIWGLLLFSPSPSACPSGGGPWGILGSPSH